MREKGFDIIISSDTEYEELCAEIYFDREFVAIVSQEHGLKKLVIEIDSPKSEKKWIFNYFDFIEILKDAQITLEKMKKNNF